MKYVLALIAFTNPAWAACLAGEEAFMTCQIENSTKSLRVCFDDQTTFYRFGTVGKPPELTLSEPIVTVDYRPWPGVGRSIAEGATFMNDDYTTMFSQVSRGCLATKNTRISPTAVSEGYVCSRAESI